MKSLLVVDNTQMEGTVFQILDIAPSFYFMIKKQETFCNSFFDIYSSFNKMRAKPYINILRNPSLHIYPENNQ